MNALPSLLQILRERKLTVSFAESCTGGKISALLTEVEGVSGQFLGSVVCYSNSSKQELLGVHPESLQNDGAVSEPVAQEMAEGARRVFHSNWSAAVTGIAGPSGGTPQKPVGTVCFAVAGPGVTRSQTQRFAGDRLSIQKQSAEFAMRWLATTIGEMN